MNESHRDVLGNDRGADDGNTGAFNGSDGSPTRVANLKLMKQLALATGLSFSETKAERALRQAERDIPPTATRAARRRLSQAGQTLGLQLAPRQLSVREAMAAVEPEAPLVAFAVSADGTARWYLLTERRGQKGRLAAILDEQDDEFLDADELARRMGVSSADDVVEWLIAQPGSPLIDDIEHQPHDGSADHDAAHGPPPMRRLLGLFRADRRDLWLVVIYAIGIGILSLATPIALMAVVNTVALATLTQQLIVLCLGLFVCLALVGLFRLLQLTVVEFVQRRIFVRVAADLAYRLPRIRTEAFDYRHGPELVNRFFDVLTAQKASASLLLDGIDVVMSTVIGLTLLASYHHVLLGFDIVLIAALAFLVWPLGRGAVATSINESRAKYAVASWLEEMARHPAAFKLSGGPLFALEQTDLLTRQYLIARSSHFRILMRQYGFALAVYALATTSLLALGGYLVIGGQLTLGQLVAAELVVTLVVVSFTKMGKQLEAYYDLLAAVDKLGYLFDLPLERVGGVVHQPQSKGARIRIHDVTFSYKTGRRNVIDRFSLSIEPGERVALLGPNGAGKSTLVDLLFGTRIPNQGLVEIDGQDLRDVQLESLREHVTVVRGVEIVAGTVLENVRMGREEISVAEVRRALTEVRLLDDILDLPEGLNTPLLAGGLPLSLGQAERLMLARAIAGQPRLLVLDEVLDDMDREVRDEVFPLLFSGAAHWTLLVITHSQEVAQCCDRSVLLNRQRPVVASDARSHVPDTLVK